MVSKREEAGQCIYFTEMMLVQIVELIPVPETHAINRKFCTERETYCINIQVTAATTGAQHHKVGDSNTGN